MKKDLQQFYTAHPGAENLPESPIEKYLNILQRRGPDYRPRTRHVRADGTAVYTNRLFLETSPYLLQHAHNPVNWFPWGDEAFEIARQLQRPVLVSIGYATCHWCHVMEEESFEDEEIARFLNENFVAVKVDREERPDVDTVYMTALHAMGVQGGWPLNVFLTPERNPFYGGTYFPPYDHSRGIGFLSLLKRLREVFEKDTKRVMQAGHQLTEAVREMLSSVPKGNYPPSDIRKAAIRVYRERFDTVNGGLQGAPKFPSSLPVRLLLRQYKLTGDTHLLDMAGLTLKKMADAGIYDHLGGGFHRYATDEGWLIPHFEKMLYDNALLALTYLEGYQLLGDVDLAAVVKDILRYLQREMAAPRGGFYSATDADSLNSSGHRGEGFFFTWTPEEVYRLLGEERGKIFATYYDVTRAGNFEGRSVLHREKTTAEVARLLNLNEDLARKVLEQSRELLYQERSRRPLPLRDEKILASWNGLAISAFARAALILNDPAAVDNAIESANFIINEMTVEGKLTHSYQEGEAKGAAFLDDYAFFIAGLIDIFEYTGEAFWLERSIELTKVVKREFLDETEGGYFMSGLSHEKLIAREKPAYDGVVPSGNSVMALNLLRLHGLTEKPYYLDQAQRAINAFAHHLNSAPTALSEMLLALDFMEDSPKQIVIVAPWGKRQAAQPLLEKLSRAFMPNRSLVVVCEGEQLQRASELVPLLKDKKAAGDKAVAYFCENRSCRLPTSDPEEFERQLRSGDTRS